MDDYFLSMKARYYENIVSSNLQLLTITNLNV